ncbi:hypothetical protein IHO40_04845 [Wolbachia endosymbiont of Mansonella ozzardi]|nr:hypothetical protein [Wolbachia endosymbiont of Mansonella ozzardi]
MLYKVSISCHTRALSPATPTPPSPVIPVPPFLVIQVADTEIQDTALVINI